MTEIMGERMDKQTFISTIKPTLKAMGYRKHANYWYNSCNGYIFCVNMQGSQWSKDRYYVEIGIAYSQPGTENPTILQWHCRHRCQGRNGDVNILPEELVNYLTTFQNAISTASTISEFLSQNNAIQVANQYWF